MNSHVEFRRHLSFQRVCMNRKRIYILLFCTDGRVVTSNNVHSYNQSPTNISPMADVVESARFPYLCFKSGSLLKACYDFHYPLQIARISIFTLRPESFHIRLLPRVNAFVELYNIYFKLTIESC